MKNHHEKSPLESYESLNHSITIKSQEMPYIIRFSRNDSVQLQLPRGTHWSTDAGHLLVPRGTSIAGAGVQR